MTTWIAFLRGINVTGKNMLPMKSLAALLEEAGLSDVATYLQSGNVVFRSSQSQPSKLAKRISSSFATAHGFSPRIFLLQLGELEQAATSNPFRQAEAAAEITALLFPLRTAGQAESGGAQAGQAGQRKLCPRRQGVLSPRARRHRELETGSRGSKGSLESMPRLETGTRSAMCWRWQLHIEITKIR